MRSNRSKKEKIKIAAWVQGKEKDRITCIFQLEARSIRLLRQVAKQIAGSESGEGFNPKNKERILLIKRDFFSVKDFNKFKKNFKYEIERV